MSLNFTPAEPKLFAFGKHHLYYLDLIGNTWAVTKIPAKADFGGTLQEALDWCQKQEDAGDV